MNRIAAYLPFLLAACWEPKSTGPNTMIGRVLDARGEPIAGLSIQTVEAADTTDADGRFGVSYKAPSQSLHFDHGGLTWTRAYAGASDDGHDIDIKLAPLHTTPLICEHRDACDAVITWEIAPNTRATLRTSCKLSTTQHLAIPEGLPTDATCREPGQAKGIVFTPHKDGAALVLRPTPTAFLVNLVTREAPLPQQCTVRVDGQVANALNNGMYAAKGGGRVQIDARCDGLYGTPIMAYVGSARTERVTLRWKRPSRTLDLHSLPSVPSQVRLRMIRGVNAGWSLPLTVTDGMATLPDLLDGDYVISFASTEPNPIDWQALPHARHAGRVELLPMTDPAGPPLGVLTIASGEQPSPLPIVNLNTQ